MTPMPKTLLLTNTDTPDSFLKTQTCSTDAKWPDCSPFKLCEDSTIKEFVLQEDDGLCSALFSLPSNQMEVERNVSFQEAKTSNFYDEPQIVGDGTSKSQNIQVKWEEKTDRAFRVNSKEAANKKCCVKQNRKIWHTKNNENLGSASQKGKVSDVWRSKHAISKTERVQKQVLSQKSQFFFPFKFERSNSFNS